jgi:hypothetical protein
MNKYDTRHGGPYDRGSADSYYRRGIYPHYYRGKTNLSERIEKLTEEEIKAYMAGYMDNEKAGDFKEWE